MPNITGLYATNYLPLLKQLASDLMQWAQELLSWFGRIAVIRMVALPRLLYIFQTLPIAVPLSFFKSLKALMTQFLWNGTKPRLSWHQF